MRDRNLTTAGPCKGFLLIVVSMLMSAACLCLSPSPVSASDSSSPNTHDRAGQVSGDPEEGMESTETLDQRPGPVESMGRELVLDAKYILNAPLNMDRRSAMGLGIAALSLGGLMLADEDIREYAQRQHSDSKTDLADVLEKTGSSGSVFLVNMGLIGTGLWIRENRGGNKLLDTALLSTEAQLFAETISGALKLAVGRRRPGDGRGSDSFDPFNEFDRSFPSSHAARSFAVATVFAERYEQPVPFMAYSAAALISLARIYQDDHFSSDVLAGAGLGYLIGKLLTHRHRETASRITLLPFALNNRSGFGLAFRYAF